MGRSLFAYRPVCFEREDWLAGPRVFFDRSKVKYTLLFLFAVGHLYAPVPHMAARTRGHSMLLVA